MATVVPLWEDTERTATVKDFHLAGADLEFDKDVLCAFPRLHSTETRLGRFISRNFHLSSFCSSPIRTHGHSLNFPHSHNLSPSNPITRFQFAPFSINFHTIPGPAKCQILLIKKAILSSRTLCTTRSDSRFVTKRSLAVLSVP